MSAVLQPSGDLAARIGSLSGINPYLCYQCKKCTTGCPVAASADVHPAQVMRAVQFGDTSMSVDSRLIWLCTGCQTCSTRCPQGIDVAGVMDELRMIAREDGRVHADAPFAEVLEGNYRSFTRWGRLYEVGLISLTLLRHPKDALAYAGIGPVMLRKGKIGLLPDPTGSRRMRRMARAATRADVRRRALAKREAAGRAVGSGGR